MSAPETTLGFVPGGGTSVLPRALGLPRDPVEAARAIAVGRTRTISLGRANGRRFGFAAGVGLDAELIRRMDARGRDENGKRPGDLVFAWTACRRSRRIVFASSRCSRSSGTDEPRSRSSRTPIRTATSASCRSAFRAAPGSRAVSTCSRPGRCAARSLPGAVRYLVTGRTGLPLVLLRDSDRIEVRCDGPMPLQLDGEDVGDVTEVVFEAERDAVSVLV